MGRRWGIWPSKAAMWGDHLACGRCGAERGKPCETRSGNEATHAHGGRELVTAARPPERPRREKPDAVALWHRRNVEAMARQQAEERRRERPALRQEMSIPPWNPWPC